MTGFQTKQQRNFSINKDVYIYQHALLFIETKKTEYMILVVYEVTLLYQSFQSSASQS